MEADDSYALKFDLTPLSRDNKAFFVLTTG